jgi:hypothetical protein
MWRRRPFRVSNKASRPSKVLATSPFIAGQGPANSSANGLVIPDMAALARLLAFDATRLLIAAFPGGGSREKADDLLEQPSPPVTEGCSG